MVEERKLSNKIEAKGLKESLEKIKEDKKEKSLENLEQSSEREKTTEDFSDFGEGISSEEQLGESTAGIATIARQRKNKEERKKKIEEVLSKDLGGIYVKMSPAQRAEFKKKGEETTEEINNLLDKTKVKLRKVVNLIKKWLAVIPGVNRFFLEQEAKIKADEILRIKEERDFE